MKKNEKVGVVTLYNCYNYGAVLQAYATCKYIKLLGYDSLAISRNIVNYSFSNDKDIAEREYEKLKRRLSRKYSGEELKRKIREKLYQKGLSYEEE